MIFNSFTFLVFLAVVLPVYFCLGRRWQNVFLLGASYVFYGWWDWRFLSLILISTVVDYGCGLMLSRTTSRHYRKWILTASIVSNLGILGFFKYYGFFAASLAQVLQSMGVPINTGTLHIVLPVGISFYTFQTLSYTIDVYRKDMPPERNFLTFALYVCYFPQLVAGPIERAQRLLPQFRNDRQSSSETVMSGIVLMVVGLFKKIAIADYIAPHIDTFFSAPQEASGLELLFGIYLFAIQIYYDFSGYSDIARGISRILGIELMPNFRQPYFSTSITTFWRRWHMSLSAWLRDYLYIPLGGSRKGKLLTYRNLITTMLLGGLWHGAGWRFVVWGGLHGVYLAVEKMLGIGGRREDASRPRMLQHATGLIRGLGVFHLVCFSWIFFRAPSFPASAAYVRGILGADFKIPVLTTFYLIMAVMLAGLVELPQALLKQDDFPVRWRPAHCGLYLGGLLMLMMIFGDAEYVPFIYFQF